MMFVWQQCFGLRIQKCFVVPMVSKYKKYNSNFLTFLRKTIRCSLEPFKYEL